MKRRIVIVVNDFVTLESEEYEVDINSPILYPPYDKSTQQDFYELDKFKISNSICDYKRWYTKDIEEKLTIPDGLYYIYNNKIIKASADKYETDTEPLYIIKEVERDADD